MGHLYQHSRTIIPTWLSDHMPIKVEFWEWISNLISHIIMDAYYLSMLGLKLNHDLIWPACATQYPVEWMEVKRWHKQDKSKYMPIGKQTSTAYFSHHYHDCKMSLYSWHPLSWWRHQMETLSALLAICAGNPPVPGEFPAQRPVTRSFDVFFDLCLNKRWFETLSRPLWRHCNVKSRPNWHHD